MGDRCGMTLCCREEHRGIFEEIGFHVVETRPDGLHMEAAEMNYGGDSEMRGLAAKGIPFHASHGGGYEYGDGRYACDGRRLVHVDCLHGGGPPAIEVDDDGNPNADQMHAVHEFNEALAAARKAIIEGLPAGFRWKSADEILKAMDPGLFREQRRWLLAIVQAIREGTLVDAGGLDWKAAADMLDGLENMLDDVADYANDVLGMDCLLEERPEEG